MLTGRPVGARFLAALFFLDVVVIRLLTLLWLRLVLDLASFLALTMLMFVRLDHDVTDLTTLGFR